MYLILPLAGKGERFANVGYTTPKPLIKLPDGTMMFQRALKSFDLKRFEKIILVVLQEHCDQFSIDKIIKNNIKHPGLSIVRLSNVTRGQAESVLIALKENNVEKDFIVFNGDSAFEGSLEMLFEDDGKTISGALQLFKDTEPRWSFAKIGKELTVIETKEKIVLSDDASTGLYYFNNASDYVKYYTKNALSCGEYYISTIYNEMIKDDLKIVGFYCEKYYCFGTPEDLREYCSGHYYKGPC